MHQKRGPVKPDSETDYSCLRVSVEGGKPSGCTSKHWGVNEVPPSPTRGQSRFTEPRRSVPPVTPATDPSSDDKRRQSRLPREEGRHAVECAV